MLWRMLKPAISKSTFSRSTVEKIPSNSAKYSRHAKVLVISSILHFIQSCVTLSYNRMLIFKQLYIFYIYIILCIPRWVVTGTFAGKCISLLPFKVIEWLSSSGPTSRGRRVLRRLLSLSVFLELPTLLSPLRLPWWPSTLTTPRSPFRHHLHPALPSHSETCIISMKDARHHRATSNVSVVSSRLTSPVIAIILCLPILRMFALTTRWTGLSMKLLPINGLRRFGAIALMYNVQCGRFIVIKSSWLW